MNRDTMEAAVVEAKRFVDMAELCFKQETPYGCFRGSKETAAARRASMDLTRKLAELRNGL